MEAEIIIDILPIGFRILSILQRSPKPYSNHEGPYIGPGLVKAWGTRWRFSMDRSQSTSWCLERKFAHKGPAYATGTKSWQVNV